MTRGAYQRYGKRVFDVVVSATLLLLLSPLFAVAAVGIRVTTGVPVLFRQQRPGIHGIPFVLFKFRSMTSETDALGKVLPDAERLTAVGRVLRRTSIDELPELFNVLRGDMSLVGPRPLLMEYLPRYSPEQARRHLVRPGITGLAQVQGRNLLSWDEKFRLDSHYVDHVSLTGDLAILCRTVAAVVSGHGVSQEGCVTAEKFRGMK